MLKCPKCKSDNIADEGLTYSANKQSTQKPIYKCKDCGEVFKIDENLRKIKKKPQLNKR